MRLKNLFKSDVVKFGAGVAVGAAATYFATAIKDKVTDVRKSVQDYRKKLFPSVGEQDAGKEAAAAKEAKNLKIYAAGNAPGAKPRGSFIEALARALSSLFGRRT